MLIFNIAGLLVAIPRFFIWDTTRRGTVLMNVMWCCFNIIILGVCTAVARELMQRRTTVRLNISTPLLVKLPDGVFISGQTVDMSNGGAGIQLGEAVDLAPDAEVSLQFPQPPESIPIRAKVVSLEGESVLRVCFDDLSIAEQEVLTMQLYSRADSWLGWGEGRESDNVLRSLGRIFTISMRGLKATTLSLFGRDDLAARRKSASLSIAQSGIILLFAALLVAGSPKSLGQTPPNSANTTSSAGPAVSPGQFHDTFTLAEAGSPQIELHSIDRQHNIYFTLPQTHVVRTATIHVLLHLFSLAHSATQPAQAHPERHALRDDPARGREVWRLRRQRLRGRLQHSSRVARS